MKAFQWLMAASGLILITVSGCSRDDDTVFHSHFYTSQDNDSVHLSLYIDDNYEGELPNLTKMPDCDDNETALYRKLESGKYRLTTKDQNGKTVNESVLKIKQNSSSVTGKAGGDAMTVKDDCLFVEFF